MRKSEFKLTGIKIIKFTILLLVVDFCLGFISNQIFVNQKTGKFHRSTYSIYEAKEDILIFGSSHAHRHYVPDVIEKELSKTCYNAGAEGQQLLYHTALLKMILKRTQPKLLVLNIDENFLYKSSKAHDRLSDLHPYYEDFKHELRPILGINSSLIDFKLFFKSYQKNSTLIHALRYYLSPQIDYKGYRPLDDKMTPEKVAIHEKNHSEKEFIEEIDDYFVRALKDFISEAKRNNAKLLFVTSPNLIERNVSNNESLNRIKEIADSEEIPFLDFLNTPKYTNQFELFHDPSHLNDDGARLFTGELAHFISSSMKI